jgi:hypothetical protein
VRRVFHRVGPLAGLTVALVATVGWIGLMSYLAIRIFRAPGLGLGDGLLIQKIAINRPLVEPQVIAASAVQLPKRFVRSPRRNCPRECRLCSDCVAKLDWFLQLGRI